MELIQRPKTKIDSVSVDSTAPLILVEQLPSNSKPYPEGTTIHYKPYSYGELEQVASNTSNNPIEDINNCLSGIQTTGIDKLDMCYSDYIWVAVLRKLATFSRNKFSINFNCPFCESSVSKTEDIANIEFTDISPEVSKLPLKFSLTNGIELEWNTITVRDAINLYSKNLQDNIPAQLAVKIKNYQIEEAIDLIDKLDNGEDIDLVETANDLLDFGKAKAHIECPHCHKQPIIDLEGVALLARPFRRSKRDLVDRILSSQK